LLDKKLHLEITPNAISYVIENGYDGVYGARPLKRFLQSHVETLIAKEIIRNNLLPESVLTVDLVNDELSLSKDAFNENCHRAAEFSVSIKEFEKDLDQLKNKFNVYESHYRENLRQLKADPTNESIRSKVTQMLINKNQMSEEIKMKEDAYENLLKEQKKLENSIRKQKMMIAENNAKAELLKAKKGIIDMYKKMNINNPLLESNASEYLNRLDKEVKIDDELKSLNSRINPEDDIECEIESSNINKMLEDELAKLDQF
jgi:phage shock protein A